MIQAAKAIVRDYVRDMTLKIGLIVAVRSRLRR